MKEKVNTHKAANTICGIHMIILRLKGLLKTASTAVEGWKRLRPPESYPPATWELIVTAAIRMVEKGFSRFALAVLVQFECLLRIIEVTAIRCEHIIDEGDVRVGKDFGGMYVRIPTAKGGKDQVADIEDTRYYETHSGTDSSYTVRCVAVSGGVDLLS